MNDLHQCFVCLGRCKNPFGFSAGLSQFFLKLDQRLEALKEEGKTLEAHRLESRTHYDLEMLQEMGYCNGIENYSRHLQQRPPGSPPWTLMDYFPADYLLIVDESHMTIPQVRGMYNGDRSRKETLVEFGFRLRSALDNRPLTFEESQEGRMTEGHIYAELGEISAGVKPGRTSAEEITLFKSVGVAVQDIAAGALALERARTRGLGSTVER